MSDRDLRGEIVDALRVASETLGATRPAPLELLQTLGVEIPPTLDPGAEGTTVPLSTPEELTAWITSTEATLGDDAETLGRFRLGETLGEGGMGRIIEARDPELRRTVALKTVRDPGRVTPDQLGRFVAEAQITGQLEHPNIIPIHEIGLAGDGRVFIVM